MSENLHYHAGQIVQKECKDSKQSRARSKTRLLVTDCLSVMIEQGCERMCIYSVRHEWYKIKLCPHG